MALGAVVAQLAEQLIRNEQVAGSTPVNGSIFCERNEKVVSRDLASFKETGLLMVFI